MHTCRSTGQRTGSDLAGEAAAPGPQWWGLPKGQVTIMPARWRLEYPLHLPLPTARALPSPPDYLNKSQCLRQKVLPDMWALSPRAEWELQKIQGFPLPAMFKWLINNSYKPIHKRRKGRFSKLSSCKWSRADSLATLLTRFLFSQYLFYAS